MAKERLRFTAKVINSLRPEATYYEVRDDVLRGLVCRVQPTGAKAYHFRYKTATGQHKRLVVGDASALTVDVARERAQAMYAAALTGADPAEDRKRAKAHTLRTFLEVYGDRAHHKTADETVTRVKICFHGLLDKHLDEINSFWIENWRAARLKSGKAKATVNRDIDGIRGVLTKAVDWGFLQEHPLRRVKALRLDTGGKPRYLQPEEEERLHAALQARETEHIEKRERFNTWRREHGLTEFPDLNKLAFVDHLRPMVLLALNTGLRRGELFNLTWQDVTLEGAAPSLVVRGASAKSGKTRHIPLNTTARTTLEAWRDQTGPDGLVFKSTKGGGRFDNINKSWGEVLVKAKLKGNFRFHDLRHHFASMLVQRGVDLNTVRELMGHSDLKMTLRYAHLAPKNTAAAVALLDSNIVPMEQKAKA